MWGRFITARVVRRFPREVFAKPFTCFDLYPGGGWIGNRYNKLVYILLSTADICFTLGIFFLFFCIFVGRPFPASCPLSSAVSRPLADVRISRKIYYMCESNAAPHDLNNNRGARHQRRETMTINDNRNWKMKCNLDVGCEY